jgi:hypothetical protein
MKHWFNKNYKALIITAFLIPIITVAVVSISHVTQWYGISNPVSWSVYLSIGIEIAALSALAAISANMGSKVYFPFIVVTLIQFIGNIFFAYSYIDITSKSFKDWVDLVSPLVEFMGVEPNDYVGHKRFLALFSGGMLPIISLSFLHMLVKFTEEDRKKEQEENTIDPSEISRIKLTEDDLTRIEEVLLNSQLTNNSLTDDGGNRKELTEEEILKEAERIRTKKLTEKMKEIQKSREEVFGSFNEDENEPTALAYTGYGQQKDLEDVEDNESFDDDNISPNDYLPSDELETVNNDISQQPIEETFSFEEIELEEPEIEIVNTTFNQFGHLPIEKPEEESVSSEIQLITKEIFEPLVEPIVDNTIEDEPTLNFEIKSDNNESLSEKKNS